MARLTVLCGLPGSGKTTLARRISAVHGAVRMCPDDWMQTAGIDLWDEGLRARIEAFQWTVAQGLLVAGGDVIIEWGTWAREEREVLHSWCRGHGVLVSLIHLDVPRDELARRLMRRNDAPGEAVIPPDRIDEWIAGPFQPPTADELAAYDPVDMPPAGFVSRPWHADDLPFLWDMLYTSIHVREGYQPPPRSVLDDHDVAHYLRDFGRYPGDDAQVALGEDGHRIGAAFCRRMSVDDPGWGFVAADIPELGMAVVDGCRGRGVGRLLLQDLLERHPVMSLSVDQDNGGARRLYESLGFVWVADEGTAFTMVRS